MGDAPLPPPMEVVRVTKLKNKSTKGVTSGSDEAKVISGKMSSDPMKADTESSSDRKSDAGSYSDPKKAGIESSSDKKADTKLSMKPDTKSSSSDKKSAAKPSKILLLNCLRKLLLTCPPILTKHHLSPRVLTDPQLRSVRPRNPSHPPPSCWALLQSRRGLLSRRTYSC